MIGVEKRIKAPYYTERPTTLAGFLHGKTLPNGWLYSRGMYRTKITAEDLPEYYIRGTIYKAQGYISVLGIKDIVYRPNYHINHMHRDDFLYTVWSGDEKQGWCLKEPEALYDFIINECQG